MGYLGFFYVEAKSFEFRSAIGDGSVRLAERSRGLFRAVHMSRQSIGWFVSSMDTLRLEGEVKEFCKTFRVGNTVHILHRRENQHGRFLDLSEYGDGGRRSFVIIPEGRKGSGWAKCLSQLRRVEKSYVKEQAERTKMVESSGVALSQRRTVEPHGKSYAAVLVGQGQNQDKEELSRGKLGSGADQLLPNQELLGRKVTTFSAADLARKAGEEILPLQCLMGKFELQNLKSILRAFKEETERLLGLLDIGCMGDGLLEKAGPLKISKGKEVVLGDAGEPSGLGRSGAQGALSRGPHGLSVYSRRSTVDQSVPPVDHNVSPVVQEGSSSIQITSPVVQNLSPVAQSMSPVVQNAPPAQVKITTDTEKAGEEAERVGKVPRSPVKILKRGDLVQIVSPVVQKW